MSLIKAVSDLRRDYGKYEFSEKSVANNPFEQFKVWFQEAIDAQFLDPNAMTVSTATKDGRPSSRMVLLKNYNDRGYEFFTNYESKKGKELAENPYASILFFWDKLERQIRIDGKIEVLTTEESDEYFQTRPYESKLGAWASKQSTKLASRFGLMRDVATLMIKYPKQVPLPPFWGGYRVVPEIFEFWQGRKSRLHDRIVYEKKDNNWEIYRLYP